MNMELALQQVDPAAAGAASSGGGHWWAATGAIVGMSVSGAVLVGFMTGLVAYSWCATNAVPSLPFPLSVLLSRFACAAASQSLQGVDWAKSCWLATYTSS